MTRDSARDLLREAKLRVTAPRVSVLCALAASRTALSHTEVLELLGDTDWDQATIYRNLVKLRDAGIAAVVSRADGIARYALADAHDAHRHPHFVCDDCGRVACLPAELSESMVVDGPWASSVRSATIQLRGACPDCIEGSTTPR